MGLDYERNYLAERGIIKSFFRNPTKPINEKSATEKYRCGFIYPTITPLFSKKLLFYDFQYFVIVSAGKSDVVNSRYNDLAHMDRLLLIMSR